MPIYLQFLLSISARQYSGQLIITDTKTKVILFLAQGRLAWAVVANEDLMFDKQLPFLFQGPSVTSIEKMFRKTRGQQENGSHYFKEIVIFSENLLHVFLRGKKRPNYALVFVCRGTVNIGMVLSKSRLAVVEVESII